MCIAYSYIRFSTKIQAKGDSTRRQLAGAQDYCSTHGLKLDSSLRDIGVSAFRGKNKNKGALSVFIEKIESGEIKKGSYLIIESLDRLSREVVTDALETFLAILRQGIKIVTLDPLMKFDKANINEPANIFIVIGIMIRAREESETKSNRISKRFEAKRKAGEKIGGKIPAWVLLNESKTKFDVISDRAKIVKRIFAMSVDGYGATLIAKKFNEEKIDTFGNGEKWHSSYINKLINNPQVMGHHQHKKMVDGKSVKVDKVILDYFPCVIKEKLFYQAQKSKEQRKRGTGKIGGDKVSNLFTGILFDAETKSKMHHNNSGQNKIIVAYDALCGLTEQKSFRYEPLEESILMCCRELKATDFDGSQKGKNDLQSTLDALEGELKMIENNILKAQQKSLDVGGSDALLDLIVKYESKKNQIIDEIEKVKSDMANEGGSSVADTQDLIDLMDSTKGKNLYDLRMRLRGSIKNLISEIHCYISVRGVKRVAYLQIHFVGGGHRQIIIDTVKGVLWAWVGMRDKGDITDDIRTKKSQAKIEREIDKTGLPVSVRLVGD